MSFFFFLKARHRFKPDKKSSQGVRWGLSCGISGLLLVIMIMLRFHAEQLHQQNENLRQKLTSLNHQTIRSQEAAATLKAYHEDFAAFEACKFEQTFTPKLLRQTFSHPLEFGPASSLEQMGKNAGIICQEVSFSVPCLQDTDVFILIDKLLNQGPGIFQINEVTLRRVSSLDDGMLSKIAAGKPQILFEGRINATWIHR